MDNYRIAFKEETLDLLGELQDGLLELENNPSASEAIGRVFRAVHTIKGSGAMFGFEEVSEFAHLLETVLDKIRNKKLEGTKEIINLALDCKDMFGLLIEADGAPGAELAARKDSLIVRLIEAGAEEPIEVKPITGAATVKPKAGGISSKEETPASKAIKTEAAESVYRIRFTPGPKSFSEGFEPISIYSELKALGKTDMTARTGAIPDLKDLDPTLCYIGWSIILTTSAPLTAIQDVFMFMDSQAVLKIEKVDDADTPVDEAAPRLGDILRQRGEVDDRAMEEAERKRDPIGSFLAKTGVVTSEQVTEALQEQEAIRQQRDKRKATASSIRVAAEKLDYLVDMVGELVIAQARLTEISQRTREPDVIAIAEEVERLTTELRDSTLGIRMIPIGTTFSRFKRLVRDLGTELGKKVDLDTEGADTELDKTVIEQLGDPLVHLIRNSVDHGIEKPDVRLAAGKPEQGTVRLSASHSGGNVLISIDDDGGGLNAQKIKAKAVEKGIIAPDAEMSEKELFQLIFAAGFSTAEKVSNVSGRGVGMDVVRRAIEQLRGNITINSRQGGGTSISIRLPLTLAIIEGLLVKVSQENYVMPLQIVEECVDLTARDIEAAHGNRLARVRDELVPYVRIRDWFEVEGGRPPIEQLVITAADGERFGFVVDKVVGHHQTVIKNLGVMYSDVKGLSGATILGDGTVALIIDARGLAHAVRSR